MSLIPTTPVGAEQAGSYPAEAARPSTRPRSLGLLPFAVFVLLFLGVPVVGIALSAFRKADTENPGAHVPTLDNMAASFTGAAWAAMQNSLLVSAIAALVGGSIGLLLALAILQTRSARLHGLVTVLSSVLANSGGVPLAFSFIAAFGNAGIVTALLSLTERGFNLYSSGGLILMYQFFLIPTMVMVVLPTLAGLRREWKEAAASLGGTAWHFWSRVGIPIALPAVMSGLVLLFGASFATHASAAALVGSGGVPLVTLRISGGLSGGNLAGQENIAMALGVNMILMAVLVLLIYMPLQKRSLKWFS